MPHAIPSCPICSNPANYSFSSRDLMFDKHERYDYHQCNNCELIFIHPLPTADQISSFYPDTYDVYEEQSRIKSISSVRKSILKKYYGYTHLSTSVLDDFICFIPKLIAKSYEVQFSSGGQLLDVGCGNGRYLDGMKKLGWQTKGVEFNEGAVRICKLSGLDVHHGDLLSANFGNEIFDVINVSHVIEHIPNPIAFFAELTRILKKEGKLIIKTPNSRALGRTLFNTNWFPNEVPRHLYLFSKENLQHLAIANNLEIEKISTNTTVKLILNSVDYVIDNRGTPSKKIKWRRFIAKIYVLIAQYKKQGDELFMVFTKH